MAVDNLGNDNRGPGISVLYRNTARTRTCQAHPPEDAGLFWCAQLPQRLWLLLVHHLRLEVVHYDLMMAWQHGGMVARQMPQDLFPPFSMSTDLVCELGALFEAVVEVPPMPCAVVDLSIPIQLLQLEYWCCSARPIYFLNCVLPLTTDCLTSRSTVMTSIWNAHDAKSCRHEVLEPHSSRTRERRSA